MILSPQDVADLIGAGANISVSAEGNDYPAPALVYLADVAAKNKRMLTVRGAEDTPLDKLTEIAAAGKGFVTFVL